MNIFSRTNSKFITQIVACITYAIPEEKTANLDPCCREKYLLLSYTKLNLIKPERE